MATESADTRIFRAKRSNAHLFFPVTSLVALLAVELLIYFILQRVPDIVSFFLGMAAIVLLLVIAVAAYHAFSVFRLSYELDRDALVIHWTGPEQIVPVSSIQEIAPGGPMADTLRDEGWNWLGYRMNVGPPNWWDRIVAQMTRPRGSTLFVCTAERAYEVSVGDNTVFAAEVEQSRALGSARIVAEQRGEPHLAWVPMRSDRTLQVLLAMAVVTAIIVWAYVLWHYPALPAIIPLHHDARGQVVSTDSRSQLLYVASIGLVVLAVNVMMAFLLQFHERLAAILLLLSVTGVQLLLFVALSGLIASA